LRISFYYTSVLIGCFRQVWSRLDQNQLRLSWRIAHHCCQKHCNPYQNLELLGQYYYLHVWWKRSSRKLMLGARNLSSLVYTVYARGRSNRGNMRSLWIWSWLRLTLAPLWGDLSLRWRQNQFEFCKFTYLYRNRRVFRSVFIAR
jgi:hypothetical protein